jgi:predicted PurR-regulated permease PerM
LINFVIMLVTLYYFLKDGTRVVARLQELEVVPGEYETVFVQQFKQVTYATLYGGILTACAQGLLGGVGFWLVSLPGPVLWGALMAFLSLIPVVGTFLVWGPAAVYLLLTGRTGAGIFLIAWGTVVVGSPKVWEP